MEWAVDDELIAANPASRIKLPKVARREPRFLDERELRAVADAIEPRFRALILVLGYTGIRIGEAAFLQLRHFDPSHRRILVAGTTAQLDGGRLIRKETKTGVVDAITLPTAISDILAGHVEVFVGWSDASAHLFPGPGGGPLYANNCRRREFATACRKALTPPFPRVHDLRHSAAAIALAHGASERQTADLLGHRSTRLVSERYGHTLPDLQNVLAKRLDASFRTIELEHQRDEGEKGRK